MISYKNAFTLVETLVVMAIISMMIGLLAPKGQKFLDNMHKILSKHEKINKIREKRLNAFLKDNHDPKYIIFKIKERNE